MVRGVGERLRGWDRCPSYELPQNKGNLVTHKRMPTPFGPLGWIAVLTALALVLPAAVSLAGEEPQADKEASQTKSDPFAVPEGGAEALQDFIGEMKSRRPEGQTQEEFYEDYRRIQTAILGAVDKLLAEKIDVDVRTAALTYKLQAYSLLVQLGDESAGQKLVTESGAIRRMLAKAPRNIMNSRLALALAEALENSGNTELAADAYREFSALFAQSEDEQIAESARKWRGVARRLTLLGKPMLVNGTQLDGKPLDWSAYKGKVVLIDFWATWCGPCIDELPNVIENYERYHQRGFEVVGISLDDEKAKVEQFVAHQELPWVTLFSDDPQATGWNHPMADYYGVMGIPTVILVGKDGKVVDLNARGTRLGRLLEEQLGPIEEQPAGR